MGMPVALSRMVSRLSPTAKQNVIIIMIPRIPLRTVAHNMALGKTRPASFSSSLICCLVSDLRV